jgi:glycosyltransferase involved in cell wall biosynthesis
MEIDRVSIVLTVFNGETFLREAIGSCLNQTYSNIELIIVDDGSTDKSIEIIDSFNDPRIMFIKNQINKGQSFSRNRAIKESSGEFIAIMDSDDIADPDRIRKQINYLVNSNVDICFSFADLIDSFGNITGLKTITQNDNLLKAQLLFYCPLIHPTAFWRKESFIKYGLWYDEYFIYSQDYDLWTRAIKKLRFGIINESLLKFRFRNYQSISYSKVGKQEEFRKVISDRELYELNDKLNYFKGSLMSIRKIFLSFKRKYKVDDEIKLFFRDLTNDKFITWPYRLRKFAQKLIIN